MTPKKSAWTPGGRGIRRWCFQRYGLVGANGHQGAMATGSQRNRAHRKSDSQRGSVPERPGEKCRCDIQLEPETRGEGHGEDRQAAIPAIEADHRDVRLHGVFMEFQSTGGSATIAVDQFHMQPVVVPWTEPGHLAFSAHLCAVGRG